MDMRKLTVKEKLEKLYRLPSNRNYILFISKWNPEVKKWCSWKDLKTKSTLTGLHHTWKTWRKFKKKKSFMLQWRLNDVRNFCQ